MTLRGLEQLLQKLGAPTEGVREVARHIGECKKKLQQAQNPEMAQKIVGEYRKILTEAVEGIKNQAKRAYRKQAGKLKLAMDAHGDKAAESAFIELTKVYDVIQKVQIVPPRPQPSVRRGIQIMVQHPIQQFIHRQGGHVFVHMAPMTSTTASTTNSATYVTFMRPGPFPK